MSRQSQLARAALVYAKLGFAVFPCRRRAKEPLAEHGCKDATTDLAQIHAWWERGPDANVGIATGLVSGIVVLDIDPRHGGDDALAELEAKNERLPDTPRVLTGGGGIHVWFKHPGGAAIPNSVGTIGPGIDVRGDGGYVIVPPSVHASDTLYRWEETLRIDGLPLAEIPNWLLDLMRGASAGTAKAWFTPPEEFEEGRRNDYLYRTARSFKERYGLNADEILSSLRGINAARCRPPLDEGELRQIARNAATQPNAAGFDKAADTEPPAFFGFTKIDQVREKLTELKHRAIGDVSIYHSDEFLKAAAATEEFDPGEFIRLRYNIVKARGVGVSAWERAVREILRKERARLAEETKAAKAATAAQPKPGSGQVLDFADPAPCTQPVDGPTLADAIAKTVRRFVVMGQHEITTIVLWVFFTYLIAVFDLAPRLAILSPEMRCGKSTLLILLGKVVYRALSCSNISPSAIYRTIEKVFPTLLIDEADTQLSTSGDDSKAKELIGILNSGHDRALAFVIRLGPGCDDYEPRKFSTFTPMVTALIGKLPRTLADRSIAIEMKRKRVSEKVERFGGRDKKKNDAQFGALRSRIVRWCADHRDAVAAAEPELPRGLLEDRADDRAGDNWRVLFAVADELGGEWPERAREAALALSGAGTDDSVGVLLLGDLRDLFVGQETDRLPSASICAALAEMEERPWPEWGRARKPITAMQVARLLRPFGVAPDSIKVKGEDGKERAIKGYLRKWLEDGFSRYLPDLGTSGRNDGTDAGAVRENDLSRNGTGESGSASENHQNAYGEKGSSAVPGQDPENGPEAEKREHSNGTAPDAEDAETDRLAKADGWDPEVGDGELIPEGPDDDPQGEF